MFGKTFKKAVSILVTAIFILSLVPVIGMAETSSVLAPYSNYVYIRSGSVSHNTHNGWLRLGSDYIPYFQLDLDGYQHILDDENTSVEFNMYMAGTGSSHTTAAFNVYLLSSDVGDYNSETLTYSNASDALKSATSGVTADQIFVAREDTTRVYDKLFAKSDADGSMKSKITNTVLGDDYNNSKLTFTAKSPSGNGHFRAEKENSGLNLIYDSALDSEDGKNAYLNKLKDKLTWNIISDETEEKNGRYIVEGTSFKALPTKFYGADVTWSVDIENIINIETGEITTPSKNTDITLTADLSYQSFDETVAPVTATKTFDITIPVFDPQEYVDGLAESFSWADVSEDQSIDAVTTNFALPSTHEDASVEWEISVSNAATLSGSTVLVTPKYTKEKATLTATLKFTYNEIVYESSKSFGVTIPEIPVGNDGSTLLSKAGGSGTSYHSQVNESEGIGGKTSDDRYIKYTDALDNPYLQLGGGAVLEASVLMTDECDDAGSYIESAIYLDDAKEETHYLSFVFEKDGIYITTSEESTKVSEMPMNEWINFVAVAPTGLNSDTGEYDHTWELYINGKCVYIGTIQSTTDIGFRYNRFRGRDPKIEIAEGESHDPSNYKTSIYIDNVSLIPVGNTYDPSIYNEAPLTMTVYDADKEGKIITLENAITVKALKDDIVTDEFTSVRVYDGEDNLLNDDTTLYDGCRVVLATTNQTSIERTYSYYEVRIADGKLLFNVPVLEVDAEGKVTTSITAHNYTGEDAQYKVYLAKYTDSTLTSVSPLTFTAEKGKATTDTSLTATLEKGETAKLFIWSGVENDYTPITVAKSVTK